MLSRRIKMCLYVDTDGMNSTLAQRKREPASRSAGRIDEEILKELVTIYIYTPDDWDLCILKSHIDDGLV